MKCPNCQSENVQELKDGKILCPGCNTVFSIEKDGAKIDKPDALDDIDDRLKKLEGKDDAGGSPAAAVAEPDEPAIPGESGEQDGSDDKIPDDNLYPA